MDAFQKNRQLSCRKLRVYRTSEKADPRLTHQITLLGAKEPNNVFVLCLLYPGMLIHNTNIK